MLKLYLENTLVELSEDFSCPITKTFEDLQNPTSIKNDFSKSIVIPHTQKNDSLFGHLYNPDRLTAASTNNTLKGIYFDPYKKIDFRIEWNDSVVMVGYLKVLSVDSKGYNCTLNGELGKIFQEMQKLTFDPFKYTGEDKDKYWIDSSQYVNTKITKELVYDSWNSNGQTDLVLRKVDDPDYKVTDIIGFTPNNAFNSDFDYTLSQIDRYKTESFADILDSKKFSDSTGVTGADLLADGLTPRGIGEFRSYLQLPFIYYNKLFSIFKSKAEILTDYSIELDESWFNANNPDWSKTVFMLLNRDELIEQKELSNATQSLWGNTTTQTICNNRGVQNITTPQQLSITLGDINTKIYNSELNCFEPTNNLNETFTVQSFKANIDLDLDVEGQASLAIDYGIKFVINAIDLNGNIIQKLGSVGYYNGRGSDNFKAEMSFSNAIVTTSFQGKKLCIVSEPFTLLARGIDKRFTLGVTIKWVKGSIAEVFPVSVVLTSGVTISGNYNLVLSKVENNDIAIRLASSTFRSNDGFILSDLWKQDYTVFDAIISYCKTYRIAIIDDPIAKKLKFIPFTTWFKDYKVLDYTSKLDKSKDYIVTPITFENRYILFNYTDGTTSIEQNYKKKFGYNVGEKRLETKYSFNTETKNLFDTSVTPSNIYSDSFLSWVVLYDKLKLYYTLPAEIFIDNKVDNNVTSAFGEIYYCNGSASFDKDEDLRQVIISDDTTYQIANNIYCYSTQNAIDCDKYLQLSLKYDNNLCVFNRPQESYTYDNDYLDNTTGIYDNYWSSYIDERYNQQNKLVTCYLDIRPVDFINFAFNKFLLIENQLYIVNKIYDYDINSNNTTKVDLITIQSIDGYTKNKLTI